MMTPHNLHMGTLFITTHGRRAFRPEAQLAFNLTTLLAVISAVQTYMYHEVYPLGLMLACWCLLFGLWRPMWFNPLYTLQQHVFNVGMKSLLALYWCFYILPSGMLMQLQGHDPLQRRFDAKSTTYWQDPQPATDMRKLT